MEIDQTTIIDQGMALSRNMILGHVTSGAYHYLLGKYMPQFTSFLKPGTSTLPTWQVAKNLSMGAEGILEKLIGGFGGDLIIRSGFIANVEGLANLGQSFDIQINGFQNNMYAVASEIQKVTKNASSIDMIFGSSSFMKIGYDEKSITNNLITGTQPVFRTIDKINNVVEDGLTSIRGLI